MSTISIKVSDVDITDDVVIKDASFQSLVNGSPGSARLRVKDVGQTYDFNTGDSLTLDVDSVRVWGGYVIGAKKVYALSVIDTTPHYPLTRLWEITGVDYNILFNKRIVWKESDPTGKLDFKYEADTYDDTIINDIFDNYLTIDDDDLTRTGVERIAKAILDVPGKTHHGSVASASYTWKQMMDRVARATGGVYYISPTRVLTYVDVETATSSYDLTDTPTDGNDVGYQGFTLLENGSDMVNDMFVWGAGTGSDSVVSSRTQDSASIAEHHRWQLGLFTSGLFRQASADIIADSYVYGTPQSHRGGKDDAVSFTIKVFEPRFTAGQVVDVTCGIFDYADALPIRSMTTTFASSRDAIFELVLGHLIDIPVGITEFRNYPPVDPEDKDPCPPGWTRGPSGQCIPPPVDDDVCDEVSGAIPMSDVIVIRHESGVETERDNVSPGSWNTGSGFLASVAGPAASRTYEIRTFLRFGPGFEAPDAVAYRVTGRLYNPNSFDDSTIEIYYGEWADPTTDPMWDEGTLVGTYTVEQGEYLPVEFTVFAFYSAEHVWIRFENISTRGDQLVEEDVVSGLVEDGASNDVITDAGWSLQWTAHATYVLGHPCGAPNSGFFCETLDHSGGADFACSKAFFSGSLEVYVNGLAQTDFTFDASFGEFHLSSAIDADDILRVCYRANGEPVT